MVKNTQKFLHWLYFTQKLDIVIFHIFFDKNFHIKITCSVGPLKNTPKNGVHFCI